MKNLNVLSLRLGAGLLALGLFAAPARADLEKKPEAKSEPAAAAKPDGKLPPAREILDRFVKESGGREAFLKHTSQSAKGKLSTPGQEIEGALEVHAAKPDKMLIKVDLGGIGKIVSGYDGKVGWSMNPLTGPTVMEGKALQQMKYQSDFYNVLHEDKNFKSMETVDKTVFEGEECYKIKLVQVNGDESTEFYSVKTGLERGSVASQESPFGPVNVTSVVSDYKKFADTVLPTKVSQKMSGVEQIMKIDEVEFDKTPESVFELPKEIKTLLEKK